jgi:hypothetical protein
MEQMRNAHKIVVGKPEGKKLLRGSRHKIGRYYQNGSWGNRAGRYEMNAPGSG